MEVHPVQKRDFANGIFDDNVRALCIGDRTVKTFCISNGGSYPRGAFKIIDKESFNPPELIDIYEIANYLSRIIGGFGLDSQYSTDTSHPSIQLSKMVKKNSSDLIMF